MRILILAGLMLSCAAVAREKTKVVCRDDAKKFCKGMSPEDRRVGICLRQHISLLSPACKERQEQKLERITAGK